MLNLSLILGIVYNSGWFLILIWNCLTLSQNHLVIANNFLLILDLNVDRVIALHLSGLLLILHVMLVFYYLAIWTHMLLRSNILHTVSASSIAAQALFGKHTLFSSRWHFPDLVFVLQVRSPIVVEVLLLEHSLLVK